MPPRAVPFYPDLDALVADCGDRKWVHPDFTGDDTVMSRMTTAACLIVDGRRCFAHADCLVARLRELSDFIRAGGTIHYVEAKTLVGLSDCPDRRKHGLYLYLDESSGTGAIRKAETPRFRCKLCGLSKPINQQRDDDICADCDD